MGKVLIIGDIMLDKTWHGKSSRICPEAPIAIVDFLREENALGGAANVAANLKALGSDPYLISTCGRDDNGSDLRLLLKNNSIDNDLIEEGKTTTKIRIFSGNHFITRIDKESYCHPSYEDTQFIIDHIKAIISDVSVIILSDYGKGFLTPVLCYCIIKIANENNVFVIVDPKKYDAFKYKGADLICPNRKELFDLTNTHDDAAGILALSELVKNILLTKSEDGMSLYSSGRRIDFPALCKDPKSTIGAGDLVVASIAHALNCKNNLDRAIDFANQIVGETMLISHQSHTLKYKNSELDK